MKVRNKMIEAIVVIGFLILIAPSFAAGQGSPQMRVNCDRGQSVQRVLDLLDRFNVPATIVVTGTCNEHIVITEDDVTIQGGTYIGSDPSKNTISVRSARRVSITGATVRGANNGVVVFQGGSLSLDQTKIQNNAKNGLVAAENSTLFLTNSTIENNGSSGVVTISSSSARIGQNILGNTGPNTIRNNGNGVAVLRSASALIDGNTIEGNSGDGLIIEGGSATVINNVIRANQAKGINVSSSGHGRIGIGDTNQAGPNLIENNGLEGVQSANSGAAYIWSNTIQNNGIASHRPGVAIYRATGRLIGDNTIQGNGGHGVEVDQGALFQGKGDFNLTPGEDIIRQNGYSGISGWNGASLEIQYVQVTGNAQNGIVLSLRSTLRIYDSTVSGNPLHGIAVYDGSAAAFYHPTGTQAAIITGNTGWGVFCGGQESSYTGDISGVTGNSSGNVSCTGF